MVRGLAGTVPRRLAPLDLTLMPPAQPLPGSILETRGPAASLAGPHGVGRAWGGVQLRPESLEPGVPRMAEMLPRPQGLMVVCASRAESL